MGQVAGTQCRHNVTRTSGNFIVIVGLPSFPSLFLSLFFLFLQILVELPLELELELGWRWRNTDSVEIAVQLIAEGGADL